MGEPMTDDEIERYIELFRKYRNFGRLPAAERKEFKALAAKWDAYEKAQGEAKRP